MGDAFGGCVQKIPSQLNQEEDTKVYFVINCVLQVKNL